MRKLQNTDIFAIGRIISKANLREEFKNISIAKDTDVESLGFDILFAIFTNCSEKEVEKEIFDFLSDIFEEPVEEVKKMNPIETMEKLKQVADWNEWKTFFSLGVKSKK